MGERIAVFYEALDTPPSLSANRVRCHNANDTVQHALALEGRLTRVPLSANNL